MTQPLQFVAEDSIITGWDFSTGAVKCLAFSLEGKTLAQVRLPTDLWTEGDVSELNLMQLEGQAHASTRAIANILQANNLLDKWVAGGISATHHTSGRIDSNRNQVRRAICWNDHSLGQFHALGLQRLGGQVRVRELIGGPWAIRYGLSHLLKDETTLSLADWQRTWGILSHGSLAAGYLTGNFQTTSISSAASTGIMDLRTNRWCREMLNALENQTYRDLAWGQLPQIVDQFEPVGKLRPGLSSECGMDPAKSPLIFPTSDDQQAGLVGGGAVAEGQMAIILGNSAVVNSSSNQAPSSEDLDAMKLNWGPYLWMRCYNNGAQFLDRIVGPSPDWEMLEKEAQAVEPGVGGIQVLPFIAPEPSLGVQKPRLEWHPTMPYEIGKRFRASLEALAYLIALGVRGHEQSGQKIARISVSGGIAKSQLMCEILATVLNRPLERLISDEGPALGAAVTALAGLETHLRRQKGNQTPFTVEDAVHSMVKFAPSIQPNPSWSKAYQQGLLSFENLLGGLK